MKIAKRSKLVMIGDSITDCGREYPIGEGGGLGTGYANMVDALLGAAYPSHAIRVMNLGIGGSTVRDLKIRWQRDVLDLQPDWLSIMIGINDVWRQFDCAKIPALHVSIEEFEQTLNDLVSRVRPGLKGLVMMTPYFVEANRQDAMRAKMDRYGAVVRSLAQKHDAIFIDTQAAFDEALTVYHPVNLACDRVHPNNVGHMIITRAFLKAIDFAW